MSNETLPSQTFASHIQLLEARKKMLNRNVLVFGTIFGIYLLVKLFLPLFTSTLPSTSVRGASDEPLIYFMATWFILLPIAQIHSIDSQIEFARFLERASQTKPTP